MNNIYDGAFRTIINDCRQFVLPFINEMFGESYDGTERVEFHQNEHFISQIDKPGDERITDTNFSVIGDVVKKYHLECESSRYSSKMLIRIFEYDAQIALDDAELGVDTIKVTFPHTSVLYLRSSRNTPEKMKVEIVVPDDEAVYYVPVAKIKEYSLDEIFEKSLYILIPFYIFNFEKDFKKYNNDEKMLEQLQIEFQEIVDRLTVLVEQGVITAFDKKTIIDLSSDVINGLTRKYSNLQKEVGDVMRGKLIDTEARRLRDAYLSEGIQQGVSKVAENMLLANKPTDEILQMTGITPEELQEISRRIGIVLV